MKIPKPAAAKPEPAKKWKLPPKKNDSGAGAAPDQESLAEVSKAAAGAGYCPECHAALATGAILCVQCGFHLKTGKKVKTKLG